MRVEEWFALALRVIGIIYFLYGAGYLLDGSLFRLGYFHYPESSSGYYIITGLFQCSVALFFIRGAAGIVRFAYPLFEPDDSVEDENANEDN